MGSRISYSPVLADSPYRSRRRWRDEAHTETGKLLHILSGVNIVASETAQILDNHAVDRSGSYILHHPLKIGTKKINTRKSVVCPFGANADFQVLISKTLLYIPSD